MNKLIIVKNGKKTEVTPVEYGEIIIKFSDGVPVYITKKAENKFNKAD